MATTDRLLIIAVFADREFAQRAIDQLKLAGLTVGQMALAAHDETTTARELGSEGNKDAAKGGMVGALIGMGVPEDDAGHYQFEYNSARIIVVVQAGDNQQKVLHILQSSWPLEIHSHVGQAGQRVLMSLSAQKRAMLIFDPQRTSLLKRILTPRSPMIASSHNHPKLKSEMIHDLEVRTPSEDR